MLVLRTRRMCWNSPWTTRDYSVRLDECSIHYHQIEATYHVITQLSDNEKPPENQLPQKRGFWDFGTSMKSAPKQLQVADQHDYLLHFQQTLILLIKLEEWQLPNFDVSVSLSLEGELSHGESTFLLLLTESLLSSLFVTNHSQNLLVLQ